MKGQAFVGLPSEQSAEKALRDTNGYVLYDKPLVVVSFYHLPHIPIADIQVMWLFVWVCVGVYN